MFGRLDLCKSACDILIADQCAEEKQISLEEDRIKNCHSASPLSDKAARQAQSCGLEREHKRDREKVKGKRKIIWRKNAMHPWARKTGPLLVNSKS